MSLTLKNILDAVMLESGVDTETAYAASSKDAVKRLLYLANRSISTLSRYPWQVLRRTHTFTLSSDTEYALPSDYRAFIPNTMYTDSHEWGVDFPADEGVWSYLQTSGGGSGERVKMRIIGDYINVYQPTSGSVVRVEYLSNTPVKSASGARKQRFTADTDTCLLDDDLVTRDILWRYKKLMGLDDWQADLMETKSLEQTLKGQEAGSQTIVPGFEASSEPYYDLWRPVPNT